MMSGVALAARALTPSIRIIGVEPELADDAVESVRSGRIVPQRPPKTIADGLRTSLGEMTFPIIRDLVDEIVTVSDEAIIEATKFTWERAKIVVEPSGAVGIAAVLDEAFASRPDADRLERVGIIVTGMQDATEDMNVELDRRKRAKMSAGYFGLDAREVEATNRVFRVLDIDGGGELALEELEDAMRALGVPTHSKFLRQTVDVFADDKTELDASDFLLLVSLCVAKAALERQESRGGHTRDDYPVMDSDWRHVLLQLSALGEDNVELVRKEQIPMRPELFDLFELDELKKYYTGEELGGHRADSAADKGEKA